MKLNKGFVFGAALVLGLSFGITACDDDDDNNGSQQGNEQSNEQNAVKLATWNFESYNYKDNASKTQFATDAAAGLKPAETLNGLVVKWNAISTLNVELTLTQGKSEEVAALQMKCKNSTEGDWADTQTKDANSNLSIEGLGSYSISKVALNAKYGKNGGKIYVTGENGTSETLIKSVDIKVKDAYSNYEISPIPADVTIIRIYGSNEALEGGGKNGSALSINDITLFGAAK